MYLGGFGVNESLSNFFLEVRLGLQGQLCLMWSMEEGWGSRSAALDFTGN